jgi:hypothetical protein
MSNVVIHNGHPIHEKANQGKSIVLRHSHSHPTEGVVWNGKNDIRFIAFHQVMDAWGNLIWPDKILPIYHPPVESCFFEPVENPA